MSASAGGKDLYKILKIHRTASKHEIKEAYRKLALALHPDRNDGCEEKAGQFKAASEAYQTLSDHGKRTAYDRTMYNTGNMKRKQPPNNYRKVYAPRPPPGFKTFDAKKHFDMHYGDGMMKEEIERARRRAEEASTRMGGTYDGEYRSPLGRGFSFDGFETKGGNPYSKRRQGPPGQNQRDQVYEYEEAYFEMGDSTSDLSSAKRAIRMKERVVDRMEERKKYRRRNRGDPSFSDLEEGSGCVIM